MILTDKQKSIFTTYVEARTEGDPANIMPLLFEIVEGGDESLVANLTAFACDLCDMAKARKLALETTALTAVDAEIAFYEGEAHG
jgi:hypothetical protein